MKFHNWADQRRYGLILDTFISQSKEYYGALCASALQSKRLSEWEPTSLPLMSRNIISPAVQHNGAFVFNGERSLSANDSKGGNEWNKSTFHLC